MTGDQTKNLTLVFLSLAVVGLAFRSGDTMRIKDFEDRMNDNPDYVWFTRSHFPSTLNEGKRVDANARLIRLCSAACAIGGTTLEPEPDSSATHGQQAVITGVTAGDPADGTEDNTAEKSPSVSGEGQRDSP